MKIAFIFCLVGMIILIHPQTARSKIVCNSGEEALFTKTLDQYFPVFLEWFEMIAEMQKELDSKLAQSIEKHRDDPYAMDAETRKASQELGHDQRLRDFYPKFGISDKEFDQFVFECINKAKNDVRAYLKLHPKFEMRLREVAPTHLLLQKEVKPEEVSLEDIEKFLPAIIEESDRQSGVMNRISEIKQIVGADPETVKRMNVQLYKESIKKHEEILEKYKITREELGRWRHPILQSSLAKSYVKNDPNLKKRFEEIVQTERCVDDPSRPDCNGKEPMSIPFLPDRDMKPEDVPHEVVEKAVMIVIEGGELISKEQREEINKLYSTNPKQAREIEMALLENNRRKYDAIVKKYGFTQREYNAWIPLVHRSSVTYQYLRDHPDLSQRFYKVLRPVPSCNDDPYQRGCEEVLKRCQEDLTQPGCEKAKRSKK